MSFYIENRKASCSIGNGNGNSDKFALLHQQQISSDLNIKTSDKSNFGIIKDCHVNNLPSGLTCYRYLEKTCLHFKSKGKNFHSKFSN